MLAVEPTMLQDMVFLKSHAFLLQWEMYHKSVIMLQWGAEGATDSLEGEAKVSGKTYGIPVKASLVVKTSY